MKRKTLSLLLILFSSFGLSAQTTTSDALEYVICKETTTTMKVVLTTANAPAGSTVSYSASLSYVGGSTAGLPTWGSEEFKLEDYEGHKAVQIKFSPTTATNNMVVTINTLVNEVVVSTLSRPINIDGIYGQTDPIDCSVSGTLLYKEDFGGNSPSDPRFAPDGSYLGTITSYKYDSEIHTHNDNLPYLDESEYFLTKNGSPHIGAPGTTGAWDPIIDHTHPGDPTRGYFMEINSGFIAGTYYKGSIDNLCEGATLLFSAWISNVLALHVGLPDAVSQVFELTADNAQPGDPALVKYYTGDIPNRTSTAWKQYGFYFNLPEGITGVSLHIINNGTGSSGNDLGLDDIQINYCGDISFVPDNNSSGYACEGDIISGTIIVNSDAHPTKYQWYYSTSSEIGVGSTWTPITGIEELEDSSWRALFQTITFDPYSVAEPHPAGYPFGYYRIKIGNGDLDNVCDYFSGPVPFLDKSAITLYWIPEKNTAKPLSEDWSDINNWYTYEGVNMGFAPDECTDVHIPGNATSYPVLVKNDTREDTCRDIYYHFGGETAQPQNLTYRHAFVMYNFGAYGSGDTPVNTDIYSATPLNRNQWYCLAAPLKSMYSGDFSVGGYPLTWQRAFQSSDKYIAEGAYSGEWAFENNAAGWKIEDQQNAISVMVTNNVVPDPNPGYDESGFTNQSYLDNVEFARVKGGNFYMPYFFENNPEQRQRLYSYDADSKENTFYYFFYDLAGLPKDPSNPDVISRGEEAYRFVFEEVIDEVSSAPSEEYTMDVPNTGSHLVMVGNPFISTLDFNAFHEANSEIDSYMTYSHTGSGTSIESWSKYAGGVENTQHIGPLQAFFISRPTTVQSSSSEELKLHFTYNQSIARNKELSLRAASSNPMRDDVIYLKAFDSRGRSASALTLSLQEIDEANNLPFVKMEEVSSPAIAALDKDGKNNMILFEGGYTGRAIPLDVFYNGTDSVTIRVQNIDRLRVDELFLIDKYENKKIDLLQGDSYTYLPKNDVRKRFEVIYLSGTSIDEPDNSSLFIRTGGNEIQVTASSTDPIKTIEVYDLQGQKLISESGLNDTYASLPCPENNGVLIVKVQTDLSSKSEKVVIPR